MDRSYLYLSSSPPKLLTRMNKLAFLLAALAAISVASAKTLSVEVSDGVEKAKQFACFRLPADGSLGSASSVTERKFGITQHSVTKDGVTITETALVPFWFGTKITASVAKNGTVNVSLLHRTLDMVVSAPDGSTEAPAYTESVFNGVIGGGTLAVDKFGGLGKVTFTVTD